MGSLGGAALCALLLLLVAAAHARAASGCSSSSSSSIGLFGGAKIVSETNVALCATGQLEVSFSGDAVAQCGCGYVGTDSWQPKGGGNLDVLGYSSHGRRQFAGRLIVSLSPVSTQTTDALRTRCPGPELGQHALVLSTLTRNALRRRVLTLALHGNAFSDGPYRVRTRSTLVLTLRRVRVRTQTFRVPSPPS